MSRSPRPAVKRRLAWAICIVLAVILGFEDAGAERFVPVGQARPALGPEQTASLAFDRNCELGTQSRALANIVDADLGVSSSRYAVAIRNLDTGESYRLNADRRMAAGSVYKLGVLYATWREIRLGRLSPDTVLTITAADAVEPEPDRGLSVGAAVTVTDALRAMITVSSNAAAHALMRTIGKSDVNGATVALGLRDTLLPTANARTGVADATREDVATTSARDMACLLTRLADGQLLGPAPSAEMRQLLFRTGGTDRIPVLLPAEARVAHKTGEIPGVRNDVAIVYAPRGTYVLAILSQNPDEGEAMAGIARLSRHIYDYFVGR